MPRSNGQAIPRAASRARPFRAYRNGLVAAGLELVAVEPATVLANNPIEARSPRMLGDTTTLVAVRRSTRSRPLEVDRTSRRRSGPPCDPDRTGAHDEVRPLPATSRLDGTVSAGVRRAVVLVGGPARPYSRALRIARTLVGEGYDVEIAAISRVGCPRSSGTGRSRSTGTCQADGSPNSRRSTPSRMLARRP